MARVFDASDRGSPAAAAAEAETREKVYAATLPEVSSSSSSNLGLTGVNGGEDEEEELELGLSLGTKKKKIDVVGGGRGGLAWGEYCRILTAEDLPSMRLRVTSPLSSSSSSSSASSSSPMMSGGRAGGAAIKSVADDGSNGVGGLANSPSGHMVVGWPPIRTYRINSLASQSKNTSSVAAVISDRKNTDTNNMKIETHLCGQDIEQKGRNPGNSCFVKVNMDGDPIGRKVDVSAYLSYEALALSLESMFCKLRSALGVSTGGQRTSKLQDGSSGFTLTYEDKDGDWMLVGDVPWGMFLHTVKRLRIMRTCDTSGLGECYCFI